MAAAFIGGKEKLEDTKGVFRDRQSKKDRQHNGQKKKDKRTNNEKQRITQKIKIVQHEPHLKPGVNLCFPDG